MSNTGAKRRAATGGRGKGGGVRAPKKGKGLNPAAEFFGQLIPDAGKQTADASADRKTRLRVARKAEDFFDRGTDLLERAEDRFEEDEATGPQRQWDDRGKRRQSDERARERAETRADTRQAVWVEERRRGMLHRDVLLALTVVTTLAAIVLVYLAVEHNQVEYLAVSMFSMALSGVEVYVMRWIRGPQEGTVEAGITPVEPPPFRWSMLHLQPEVAEAEDGEADDAAEEG